MANTVAKYQKYAEYQDSGIEWLGDIPKHWQTVSLKMLIDVRDGTHDTPPYVEPNFNTYPLVTSKDVTGGRVDLSNCKHISELDYSNIIKRSGVSKGDILMPMIGTVGSPVLVEDKFEIAIKNLALFKTSIGNEKLDSKFLFYFLNSTECETQFSLEGKGGVQNFVSLGTLRNLVLPLTKTSEQIKIANFLDHETTKIDHLIEKQQQLIELLKEKRQAVISHAVTKGLNPNVAMKDSGVEWLGEVPEHWNVKKLKYIVDLVGEKVESSNKQYVGMENISSKSGVFLQTEGILPEGISNTFNKGDILFGKLRPYLAKCWLADFSGICSSEFLVLRSKNKLSPIFLNLFLLTDQFIDQVNSSTYGSKMPRANWEFIGDLPIPVPDEQSSIDIANFLERQTQKYDSLIIKVSQQIALMQERRTALISAAVTGKIDVRHWQSPTVAEAETELSA